jgi:hypothetical protein
MRLTRRKWPEIIESSKGDRVVGGLGRDRKGKAIDKKQIRNPDT